jgi:hypothetical protein
MAPPARSCSAASRLRSKTAGERSAPGVPALTRPVKVASADNAAHSGGGTVSSPSISASAARARRTTCSLRSV